MKALEGEIADLGERLETRKQVDRAKGILMDDHGMAESEAFSWVQRRAMQERKTMRTIAAEIISGDLRPEA
jgi:response regulator NasT